MQSFRQLYAAVIVLVMALAIPAQIKIACIGTSITSGLYPALLQQKLGTNYLVQNDGFGGMTMLKQGDVSYWNSVTFPQVFALKPTIVTIELGTNDSKPVNWDAYGQYFKRDYEAMIDTLNTISSKPKIFLVECTPAWANTLFVRGDTLQQDIIPIIRQIAAERLLPLIDCNTPLVNRSDLFFDGVHPDSAGADTIAGIFQRAISGTSYLLVDPQSGTYGDSVAMKIYTKTGTDIRYTTDGSMPTKNSSSYNGSLVIKNSCKVTLRGYRTADSSTIDSAKYTIVSSVKQPAKAGLAYNYYEYPTTTIWDSLHSFAGMTPAGTGVSDSGFYLGMKKRNDRFALQFYGAIKIDSAGSYNFTIYSDAGSKLFIGGCCVVNNDGRTVYTVGKSGTVFLNRAVYPITLNYFQDTGSSNLSVYYACPPRVSNRKIPRTAFFYDSTSSVGALHPPAPARGPEKPVRIYSLQNGKMAVSVSYKNHYEIRVVRMDGRNVKWIAADKPDLYTFGGQELAHGIYLVTVTSAMEDISKIMLLY